MGELALIDWIRSKWQRQPGVALGPGDDAALLDDGDALLAFSIDGLADGVHFDSRAATMEQIGYKAMASNVSDMAAMGARPLATTVSVCLYDSQSMEDAKALYNGLSGVAERFGASIVGGDVISSPSSFVISVAILGRRSRKETFRRAGARAGDAIFVTGSLGGSILGRHLCFTPRVDEALYLAERFDVHSAIDVSDGLSTDLYHIVEESGVGAALDAEAVPVSADAEKLSRKDGVSSLEHALNDGEDFELLFTVAGADAERLIESWPFETRLTKIGAITGEKGAVIIRRGGAPARLEKKGYEHFKRSKAKAGIELV